MSLRLEGTLFQKTPDESLDEYCHRITQLRDTLGLTWSEVADILNTNLNTSYSPDKYRKQEEKWQTMYEENEVEDNTLYDELDIKKELYKAREERTQTAAYIRRVSREETIKEIAHDFSEQMKSVYPLLPKRKVISKDLDKEAILEISDWHYGIEINNFWNSYSREIAKDRIASLQNQVIEKIKVCNIKRLHVVNLGDLIGGLIHLQLRIASRVDVITQVMEVAELLAQFLTNLSEYVDIDYYDTLDNHSRLDPNLKDSLELESLSRIITWFLKERVGSFITIHDNIIADDIITFNVFDHKIIGVHGDKDKPNQVVDRLTLMTHQHYDMVLTAHLHHFSADEKNQTLLISNSSLMGTDSYAEKLRLSAKPAQNLIVCSKDNVFECLYRLVVN